MIHKLLDEEENSDQGMEPTGFLSKISRAFSSKPAPLPALVIEREVGDEVDLDKSWHAIHYMLTGVAEETTAKLGFIYCGGSTIGDEEVGYGPARAFSALETKEIAKHISGISKSEFLSRYDGPAMLKAKIYPEPLWAPDRAAEENHLWVSEYFESLRDFMVSAADEGKGFIIYLT